MASNVDFDKLHGAELDNVPYSALHLSGRVKKFARDLSKMLNVEISAGLMDIRGESLYLMGKIRGISKFLRKYVSINAGRMRINEFGSPHPLILVIRLTELVFLIIAAKTAIVGRAPEILNFVKLYSRFLTDYLQKHVKYVIAYCPGCKTNVSVPIDLKKVVDSGRVFPFSYFHETHILTIYVDPNGNVRGNEISEIF